MKRIRSYLAITVAILAVLAVFASTAIADPTGPTAGPTAPTGPTGPPTTSPLPPPVPCSKVAAGDFNHLLRVRRSITGNPIPRSSIAHGPVCKTEYNGLKKKVKHARRNCLHRIEHPHDRNKTGTSGASFYSYGDSGGLTGACGDHLMDVQYGFAVLGTGDVASNCGQQFYFHRHDGSGGTVKATQVDTGGGGGRAGGYPRTFDFWNHPKMRSAADVLNMTSAGLASVDYSTQNCWAR